MDEIVLHITCSTFHKNTCYSVKYQNDWRLAFSDKWKNECCEFSDILYPQQGPAHIKYHILQRHELVIAENLILLKAIEPFIK